MGKIKIKTGDKVRVIAGAQKGAEGEVKQVLREDNKAIVEGVNLSKSTLSLARRIHKEVF